jgi:DNA-binding response OmpR family regulator
MILLAEDEALLHAVLEDELTAAGYEVMIVASGTHALAELEQGAKRFKALITDIRLGSGPSGWEVAHRARELAPTIPVIYMSGDCAIQWAAHGVPNSIMVQKPFALAQLVTAVSQLINAASLILPSAH